MSFLTAEWRKLAMANYRVEPGLLAPFVPTGTELDYWEGHTYLSLVGFMFVKVRLLGIPVPFHTRFEEVNLRFYVRYKDPRLGWKRGVVFIKEIVPRHALTLVANTLYKEHYQTLPMRHRWEESGAYRLVAYSWKSRRKWQYFQVKTDSAASPIPPGSEAEFITEHYWGYTRVDPSTTLEYEVTHPKWEHYPVRDYEVAVDFADVYGPSFAFLNHRQPNSVLLAEGSPITVQSTKKLA